MEGVCEILLAEALMSKPGSEGALCLSGIPPAVIEAMKDLATDRGMTLKETYTEAARTLLDVVTKGTKVVIVSTLGGSQRKTIWIDPQVAADVGEYAQSVNRSKSAFMLTAIKHFLIANDRDVEF